MTSSVFNNEDILQLVALRSHSVRGIKKNCSTWYMPHLSCPLTCSAEDSQPHLLSSKPILDLLTPQELAKTHTVKYNDIYGCLEKQKVAVTVFSWLLDSGHPGPAARGGHTCQYDHTGCSFYTRRQLGPIIVLDFTRNT